MTTTDASFLLANEPTIRSSLFLGGLAVLAAAEAAIPRRVRSLGRLSRWPGNLGLVVLNTVLLRVTFPVAAVGMAASAHAAGFGLLNVVALPEWAAIVAGIMLLDLAIYLQHVMVHAVPLFWRLHRVHHADLDFDVTTGLRFHPAEIVLSMALKIAIVAALGPPLIAVIVFEIVLNATSMFNHANLALPTKVDEAIRTVLVTPDMHRVHHSIERNETNSNFGFNLAWWDRLFGTYRAQPRAGHAAMTIGIEDFREPGSSRLDRLLWQPLRGRARTYPINEFADALMRAETWIKALVGALLVAAIVLVIVDAKDFSPEAIETFIRDLGWWAPIAYVGFSIITVVLLGSVTFSSLLGGALFGAEAAFALNWFGTVLGAIINFALARYMIGPWIARRAGRRLRFVLDGVESEGWRFVTFIRLVPFFQFAAVSYLFGATRVQFRDYVLPTMICLMPESRRFAGLVKSVGMPPRANATSSKTDCLALGLLAVAIAIPRVVVWRRRKQRGISRETLAALRAGGADLTVVAIGDETIPDCEAVGEDDFERWAAARVGHPEHRIVIAHATESGALQALRLLDRAGAVDARYLIGGVAALRR